MSILFNINSVAKYESKLLMRSWFYRIFMILAVLFICIFNFGSLVFQSGGGNWLMKSLPANIPYINLMLLNTGQAIIAVFLSSEFLKSDKKLDTSEVFYVHSLSNAEYVIGKIWGNMRVFLRLNLFAIVLVALFNFISGVSIDWTAYIIYFVLICIPTLIYIFGLSIALMLILKSQAITFIFLLGYIAITLFYIGDKFYYLFDYMVYNLPLVKSTIVGFSNWSTLINHRMIYFMLGLGFICLSIFLFRRLPNSKTGKYRWLYLSFLFFASGLWASYNHVGTILKTENRRQTFIDVNNQYVNKPKMVIDQYDIDLNQHSQTVSTDVKMHGTALSQSAIFTFCLNPGLKVNEVTENDKALSFIRDHQILLIDFGREVALGDSVSFKLKYSGAIDESFCYLDIPSSILQEGFGSGMFKIDKRYSFQDKNYLLFTPETYWYPRPGTSYSSENPDWQQAYFSYFNLKVKTINGLKALSQGTMKWPIAKKEWVVLEEKSDNDSITTERAGREREQSSENSEEDGPIREGFTGQERSARVAERGEMRSQLNRDSLQSIAGDTTAMRRRRPEMAQDDDSAATRRPAGANRRYSDENLAERGQPGRDVGAMRQQPARNNGAARQQPLNNVVARAQQQTIGGGGTRRDRPVGQGPAGRGGNRPDMRPPISRDSLQERAGRDFQLDKNREKLVTTIEYDSIFVYETDFLTPSITLIIGDYEQKSVEVDETVYSIWNIKGNDYFSEIFNEIVETIPEQIRERRRSIETNYSLDYSYNRFSLIEVPVQFYSYTRTWTQAQEVMQPEMVLFPEKGSLVNEADVVRNFSNEKNFAQRGRGEISDEEAAISVLNRFMRFFERTQSNFDWSQERGSVNISNKPNPFFIFPQLYNFRYNVFSSEWSISNRLIELYLQDNVDDNISFRQMNGISNNEKANLLMEKAPFKELLSNIDHRDLLDNITSLKINYLFALAERNIGYSEYRDSLRAVLQRNIFTNLRFENLLDTLGVIAEVDLRSPLEAWNHPTTLPFYTIWTPEVIQVTNRDKEVFVVKQQISNDSDFDGIVDVEIMFRGGQNAFYDPREKRKVSLKAHETKNLVSVWEEAPRNININTLISANLPSSINLPTNNIIRERNRPIDEEFDYVVENVTYEMSGELIVDNEDSTLFLLSTPDVVGLLPQWLDQVDDNSFRYSGVSNWRPPLQWTLTTNDKYYGTHIRSAYVIKSGSGNQTATWKIPVLDAGQYDLFYWVYKSDELRRGYGRGRGGSSEKDSEYRFKVRYDGQEESAYINLQQSDEGWSELGSYFFSNDTVEVVLSNETKLTTVTADAVKIVRR